MFDIGWSEMMVVGVVALVVIGPKDLPAALRQAGKWMGSVRRMAADFQGHVNAAMREAELDELRREVNNLKSGMTGFADPVRSAGTDVKALVESKPTPPPVPVVADTKALAVIEKPAAKPAARRTRAAAPSKPAAATRKPARKTK